MRIETRHYSLHGVLHEEFAVIDPSGRVVLITTDYAFAKATARAIGAPWRKAVMALYAAIVLVALVIWGLLR